MNGALLVALLGALSMSTLAFGLWLPAYLRHRLLGRRLAGFVLADSQAGFAADLGGRRRPRVARRTVDDRNRWVVRRIGRMIAQAHADVSVGEVLAAVAVLFLVAFTLISIASGSLVIGGLGGLLVGATPLFWLRWRRRNIERRFDAQLLDTIALLASSVQSGHSLLQALEHITSQAPEPTRSAIGLVVREIGLGASQEDALERLADRLPSDDLELIVTAINVHQQIGGSLAKVLDAIAVTIRERVRAAGDIRSLTSQQRYSAYVLSLLPVVAAIALSLISPDYVGVLFQPGPLRQVLIVAGVFVVVGFLLMKRLARVEV